MCVNERIFRNIGVAKVSYITITHKFMNYIVKHKKLQVQQLEPYVQN